MTKILIIGGGFGGIRAALDLDKKISPKDAEITLVDKNNYHLFLPALYEIGSAVGEWKDKYHVKLRKTVNIPFADIFEGTKVHFVQAEIAGVDLEKKEAVSGGGQVFNFDYLVLGLGAETETFGLPGVLEYAYKFKSIDEALFLNQRINEAFEKLKKGQRPGPIKIIVVGAGFNGIELAAELACCAKNLQEACRVNDHCYAIKIIEAMPQILSTVSEKERSTVCKRLENLKIEILKHKKIAEVGADYVKINETEKYEGDFIIWTAGIRASSFLKNIFGLRLDKRGKMTVNNFLQADGWIDVFGVGDNTVYLDPETQKPIPGLAYVAIDEGKIAAENIYRSIKNKPLKSYQSFYSVWIAPVGGKFAVAHLTDWLTISGFGGWMVRELVDFKYFLSILPFSKAVSLLNREINIFSKND